MSASEAEWDTPEQIAKLRKVVDLPTKWPEVETNDAALARVRTPPFHVYKKQQPQQHQLTVLSKPAPLPKCRSTSAHAKAMWKQLQAWFDTT